MPGATGEPVADLQRRLAALGHPCAGDRAGAYGNATRAAVVAFQQRRGLRDDGICAEQTWSAVVEAGYRIGDRRLYQRKPMMRGDDIAELQWRLGELGFDAGKVDGIFGPDTAAALADFQRNVGLAPDAIFGRDELAALERFGRRGEGLVAELREQVDRSTLAGLDHPRVVVAERGGLDALTSALGRTLRRRHADPILLHHPDPSELAQQANAAGADVFVELASLGGEPGCRCAYYQGYRSSSPAGLALAECLLAAVPDALGVPSLGASGMFLPVLRETRMPAVICAVGPTAAIVARGPLLAVAVAAGIERWVTGS